jgi:hypothetical protein
MFPSKLRICMAFFQIRALNFLIIWHDKRIFLLTILKNITKIKNGKNSKKNIHNYNFELIEPTRPIISEKSSSILILIVLALAFPI